MQVGLSWRTNLGGIPCLWPWDRGEASQRRGGRWSVLERSHDGLQGSTMLERLSWEVRRNGVWVTPCRRAWGNVSATLPVERPCVRLGLYCNAALSTWATTPDLPISRPQRERRRWSFSAIPRPVTTAASTPPDALPLGTIAATCSNLHRRSLHARVNARPTCLTVFSGLA